MPTTADLQSTSPPPVPRSAFSTVQIQLIINSMIKAFFGKITHLHVHTYAGAVCIYPLLICEQLYMVFICCSKTSVKSKVHIDTPLAKLIHRAGPLF